MITAIQADFNCFPYEIGFIFMRCVIADITAAEVDSDEIRSRYVDQMKCLLKIMVRENVKKKLIM